MGSGVRTGLEFLREQREKSGGGASGDRLLKLWVRDGERARFWFLTDGPEIAVPMIHVVPQTRQNGSTWQADVLCVKSAPDDDAHCALCEQRRAGDETIKGPWARSVAYVWVVSFFYTSPLKKGLTAVKGSQGTLYREDLGEVRLLVAKPKLEGQIIAAYYGDETDPDYDPDAPKTLLARPYVLEVDGERQKKIETLLHGDKAEMPEAAKAARENLVPLSQQVVTEFGFGNPSIDKRQGALRGDGRASSQGYDPSRIPDDEPDDSELEEVNF